MSYSLNEIEAMSKRASRGAGYTWGLAEEASKAARWLCAHGFDGVSVLAGLLDQVNAQPLSDLSPQSITNHWDSKSGQLCPLIAGSTLSDNAALIGDHDLTLQNVLCPLLVLPFTAAAARMTKNTITVRWDGQVFVCDPSGPCCADPSPALAPLFASALTISLGGTLTSPVPVMTRATPSAANWAKLNRFAHRTLAPATDASRLSGAGAGISDND